MKKLLPLIVACCLPTGILASPLLGTWQADATALLTLGCTDFCPEQVTLPATFSEDRQYTLDILFDYEGDLWASLTEDGTDLSALGLPAMETYEIRVAGTYEDNGSTFAVTVSEHQGLVNRGDPVEFYTKAGRILARALADEASREESKTDPLQPANLSGASGHVPVLPAVDIAAGRDNHLPVLLETHKAAGERPLDRVAAVGAGTGGSGEGRARGTNEDHDQGQGGQARRSSTHSCILEGRARALPENPHSNTERGRPDWRMIDIKVPERSSP